LAEEMAGSRAMKHWRMHDRSSMRQTCPSPPIWKEDLATHPKPSRKRSSLRPKRGSIEDATGSPDRPLYEIGLAVDRIAAAAQAARRLQFPFILTARAHNLLYAEPSLDDTITRLQAFERAGADVLFAPGLPDLEAVRTVCQAVSKPVNFMAGIKGRSFSVGELAAAGVKRISLATSLYRAAMTGLLDAVSEVKNTGQFGFLERCLTTPELNNLMRI